MVEDELGATSVGTDATPKITLKAVGDNAVYELKMTRKVAEGLFDQLDSTLAELEEDEANADNNESEPSLEA